MTTIAYIVNDVGYLSHVVPLINGLKNHDHLIVTNFEQTYAYATAVLGFKSVLYSDDAKAWDLIKEMGIKNVVLLHQVIKDNPPELNKIQVFHGVSYKSNLGNWNPSRWDHVLVQGRHYWEPYKTKFPDQSYKMHQTSFARAVYYRGNQEPSKDKYAVYLPTHNDNGNTALLENVRVIAKAGIRVKIKLHPISWRTPGFMSQLNRIIDRYSTHEHVQFIRPDAWEYVNYHELFYESFCLISDFSSVVCEYTLTDKPIIIMRGYPGRKTVGGRDFGDIKDHLFFVSNRDVRESVDEALALHKPGFYPKIYFDQKNIIEKIEEVLI